MLGAENNLVWITENLGVYRDHINVGVIRDGDRALLIDCSESVGAVICDVGIDSIDKVLFTHHHRDQACGVHDLASSGASIAVPADEGQLFSEVGSFWNDPGRRWHAYDYHPYHLVLTEPVKVDELLSDGDVIEWGPARITCFATPGHAPGSLSYLVEIDGVRVAFCGDLIYDAGKIWDVYSLQRAEGTDYDYHGFMGAREQVVASLRLLVSQCPEVLIPSHGEIMREPDAASNTLIDRLAACWNNYVDISAMRFYFPDLYPQDGGMPISPVLPAPEFVRRVSYGWLVLSETGEAFVMDCGMRSVFEELRRLHSASEFASVGGLWITHYHDDHVDYIPAFRELFDCECIAEESVAQVITNPRAWRLPCLSPVEVAVDRVVRDGERWQWNEFTMTAYQFPGQTLYHAGLLVEGRGLRLFFIGDSFTPSGLDDYCAMNRNFLGEHVGYDRCLRLVRDLKPDLLFNPVTEPFAFTDEQCEYMLSNLAERERLFGQLIPWDHANYGLDDLWARCYPYEQDARPGEMASVELVVTNHSSIGHELRGGLVPPRPWRMEPGSAGSAVAAPRTETRLSLSLQVPPDAAPGRWPVAVNVEFAGRRLPRVAEAVLVVALPETISRKGTTSIHE